MCAYRKRQQTLWRKYSHPVLCYTHIIMTQIYEGHQFSERFLMTFQHHVCLPSSHLYLFINFQTLAVLRNMTPWRIALGYYSKRELYLFLPWNFLGTCEQLHYPTMGKEHGWEQSLQPIQKVITFQLNALIYRKEHLLEDF